MEHWSSVEAIGRHVTDIMSIDISLILSVVAFNVFAHKAYLKERVKENLVELRIPDLTGIAVSWSYWVYIYHSYQIE